MGKLVDFEKFWRAVPAKSAGTGGGQILIFTGVRYQRGAPLLPTNGSKPERPKRKRG